MGRAAIVHGTRPGPPISISPPMRPDLRSIRHRLEHRLFRALGLERASALSGILWRLAAPWSKRHRRVLKHVALRLPEMSADRREATVRSIWEDLGRTFAEAFFLPETGGGARVTIENQAAFDEWRAWPGGEVACTAHLASWELAIALATLGGLEHLQAAAQPARRRRCPRAAPAALSRRARPEG